MMRFSGRPFSVRKHSEKTAGKRSYVTGFMCNHHTHRLSRTQECRTTSSASERGTRVTSQSKCRFVHSCVVMTRSPLAFAMGWVCIFVLVFAPRVHAWHPNPHDLLPFEHCTGEGGECSCNGIARWGWPMDMKKHPEYEDGYQWVRPPPKALRSRPPRVFAKRPQTPRATTPASFPRNR